MITGRWSDSGVCTAYAPSTSHAAPAPLTYAKSTVVPVQCVSGGAGRPNFVRLCTFPGITISAPQDRKTMDASPAATAPARVGGGEEKGGMPGDHRGEGGGEGAAGEQAAAVLG